MVTQQSVGRHLPSVCAVFSGLSPKQCGERRAKGSALEGFGWEGRPVRVRGTEGPRLVFTEHREASDVVPNVRKSYLQGVF